MIGGYRTAIYSIRRVWVLGSTFSKNLNSKLSQNTGLLGTAHKVPHAEQQNRVTARFFGFVVLTHHGSRHQKRPAQKVWNCGSLKGTRPTKSLSQKQFAVDPSNRRVHW